jgi:RNA 2',3'-cyclic 3'-phosphodiesterase
MPASAIPTGGVRRLLFTGSVNDERARLFVALELPERVVRELVRWRQGAVEGIDGVRLVRSEDLHVTLCFLGSRLVHEIEAIAAACQGVAATGTAPLRVGEPIWLPRRRPRVLAVGLEDLEGALGRAQGTLAEALVDGGWYEPEGRQYLAHATVARLGRAARVPAARSRSIEAPRALTFEGATVTLYRSRLSPKGARYEALASVAL